MPSIRASPASVSEPSIRPLRAGDIPACAAIMADSPLWQRYGVTQQSAARRLQIGCDDLETIAVAELDEQVAGFIWYVLDGAFHRSGYVMLIAVRDDLRGGGVGQALMAHAETEMFAFVRDVFLLVSDFNLGAQRFYRRLGYEQVGAIPDYILPGISELIFHKRR